MNPNIVEKILEYVKGSPETMDYGMWGALNPQQRDLIKKLCNSWLVLNDATNKQTKEIERLNNIIKEVREYIEDTPKIVKSIHFNQKKVKDDLPAIIIFLENTFKNDIRNILDKGE